MKRWVFLLLSLACALPAIAAVDPVTLKVPTPSGWAGQRIPLLIELRAPGSFSGTATFELPQLPGALLVKIGSPVVGSEEIDGESWFVQSHEFALFGQHQGALDIPPFTVHFSHQEGYTGPVSEVKAETQAISVEIKRPPGTEPSAMVLTTNSFTVHQTWEPQPGPVQVGAVLKRTIDQEAVNVSGMVLGASSTAAPDGVRLYPVDARTEDNAERGDLVGKRHETLTYFVTAPGTHTLPTLAYAWWDPDKEQLQSATLPGVTLTATPAPSSLTEATAGKKSILGYCLGGVALAVAGGLSQRQRLRRWLPVLKSRIYPLEKKVLRRLLAACAGNDAHGAQTAWFALLGLRGGGYAPEPAIQAAVLELYRNIYGSAAETSWNGQHLRQALETQLKTRPSQSTGRSDAALPALNP